LPIREVAVKMKAGVDGRRNAIAEGKGEEGSITVTLHFTDLNAELKQCAVREILQCNYGRLQIRIPHNSSTNLFIHQLMVA